MDTLDNYIPGDTDPDEDIDTVFDAMDAWERNKREHDAAKAQQEHDNVLSAFFRDGLRVRTLDAYDPAMWDPSQVPAEVRGAWPKGISHGNRN